MNFVQALQENWHSLPGWMQGALSAAGGAGIGVIELAFNEGLSWDLPHLKLLLGHAAGAAILAFLFYLVPPSRRPQGSPPPPPAIKP